MEAIDYASRFHEALMKTFAARSPAVRSAYCDLAEFYRTRMRLGPVPHAPAATLRICRRKMAIARKSPAN